MPTDRPVVPTLFCINAGYAQHLAACLASLLTNNPEKFFELVVVFTGDLGASKEKLSRTVAAFDNATLTMAPFVPPPMALPLRIHYSVDIYSRLWIGDFFPAETARVLYLDADIIVSGPIDELWHADLNGNILAAVTIPNSDRAAYLGIPARYRYFNSGVMVFDLAAWRREHIADRILDYVARNTEKLIDPDQDALNACLFDRRLPLDYVWNVISPFYYSSNPLRIPVADREAAVRGARIIHFNGASKPWSYLCRHPRKADYYRYLRQTEWRDFQPPDRTAVNWLKRNIWHHVATVIRDRGVARRTSPPEPDEGGAERRSSEQAP